ncbi:Hypp4273 [Branchiostoma lanceolatum]|uniref:Hypp4273 protein n=1 Tax=Branchiostoma lanceolatum TaxID=7740 RepID=A0A8K0F0D9_BRALA|nr:Hypp4273 [Branchiostoma lanceolatum]
MLGRGSQEFKWARGKTQQRKSSVPAIFQRGLSRDTIFAQAGKTPPSTPETTPETARKDSSPMLLRRGSASKVMPPPKFPAPKTKKKDKKDKKSRGLRKAESDPDVTGGFA